MKSSIDRRPWNSWITSNRKGFHGVRRKATCCGNCECSNPNCSFTKYYGRSNKLQFNKNDFSCNVCGTTGEFKSCPATKVWDFEDVDSLFYSKVTIFHTNNHTCDARKPFQPL